VRAMGDKMAGRRVALSLGVPVVPGASEPVTDDKDAARVAEDVGYPVMLKAVMGGGGKGMRLVHRREDLAGALRAARSEAGAAFGDASVYIERYLAAPRHVEIQILADAHGSTVHLGERECSIQRRHQKLIEESPSPGVDAELRRRMGAAACRLSAPAGPCVRNDSGVYAGYTVPRYYDTLMAKLIVWAPDREAAVARMERALGEYQVGGVRSTVPVLRRILRHPDFVAGKLDTQFMERLIDAPAPGRHRTLALIAAALAAYER